MDNVTRNVITDLWPLYLSGDASEDSRRLVDDYLAADPEFARALRDTANPSLAPGAAPSLPPDHELKTLDRIKRRLRGPHWILQLALVFTALAFGRIVSDTSWDVSPRHFIATAVVAACFWIAFFVVLFRGRRAVLVRLR
jgi:ferric-dicitrate binding protein FerR (iron transport regulator)